MVPQHLVPGRRWLEARLAPGRRRQGAAVEAHHTDPLFQESLPDYVLYCEEDVPLLFTENETNNARLFGTRTHPRM